MRSPASLNSGRSGILRSSRTAQCVLADKQQSSAKRGWAFDGEACLKSFEPTGEERSGEPAPMVFRPFRDRQAMTAGQVFSGCRQIGVVQVIQVDRRNSQC